MKKQLGFSLILLIFILIIINNKNHEQKINSAVTYKLDCGRFGDQLLNYIKAVWISWKFSLPLLYRPFAYSDQLELSKIHTDSFNNLVLKNYETLIEFGNQSSFDRICEQFNQTKNSTLYLVSFYIPIWEFEDEKFRKKLSELIKPKKIIKTLELPKDCITLAVHVRSRNNTYDLKSNIENMPTKFPPDSFYISGIKHIANYFKDQFLYIYIFTDDPEPSSIKKLFIKELQNSKIQNFKIDCRNTENNHNINVLEDFFSMMKFDCLIRPHSSFSGCVAAISAPLIEIQPSQWSNKISIIDSLVKIRSEKGKEIVKTYIVKGP